jgi:YaiO family outer membrane protein
LSDPAHVLAVAEHLDPTLLGLLQQSPRWWFSWRWLENDRLGGRSLRRLELEAEELAAQPAIRDALTRLQPALDAGLPASELWLRAARLLDLEGRDTESEAAFEHAYHLGCGRVDAEVLRLARRARSRPLATAREIAERLEVAPDHSLLRASLVHALLRAGQVSAAERALAPLLEEDPYEPETLTLAAEVRAAQGRVRQARSLYESQLRLDPLAADPRAARWALRDAHELGVDAGFEYQVRSDTTGEASETEDWQEAFVSGFWRLPNQRTFAAEIRAFQREPGTDYQLQAEYLESIGAHALGRVRVGLAPDAEFVARWRVGLGISQEVVESVYMNLDANYLRFTGLDVWQVVPGVTWRWHPRGTWEGRVYLSRNTLDSGGATTTVTGYLSHGWQLGGQSLLVVHGAYGDENAANPTLDLIGKDSFSSAGIYVRWGWRHRWALTPGYRYERHERFDMHALSLGLGWRY